MQRAASRPGPDEGGTVKGICEGRVAIVTGGGRGIGRAHALELARQGAHVVVNDLGTARDGAGADDAVAHAVVQEIRAAGGSAVANAEDIADWDGAERLVQQAIAEFGQLDVLVNNAGILRDRSVLAMSPDEWDMVIRTHLRGTVAPAHFAAAHWRARAGQTGMPTGGRLINTTSASGLYGNAGQSNYGAAKAGIAAFTVIAAKELAPYGVTVNALAPAARTRHTAALMPANRELEPEHVAVLLAWLASTESAGVTGRVFDVGGGQIGLIEPWRLGPTVYRNGGWLATELGSIIPELAQAAIPHVDMQGQPRGNALTCR
jgi:NAD(P)-dependent dehydrogenase (short-subunit alcohol dehydrogenase family)